MSDVIVLEGVRKAFDGHEVLHDLSVAVAPGIVFGLLGPSGSGKTTAIRTMIGVYRPDGGRVAVLGRDPTKWTTRIRENVGYMPQIAFQYPSLTVAESINFSASIYGMGWFRRRDRVRRLLEIVDLWADRDKLVQKLSGGMRKRLALACSLVHDPSLIFLDEPTAGIDPILRQHFWGFFRELRNQGKTILVTSHYVAEAEDCDLVAVIDDGRLIALGSPLELRRQALGGDALDVVTHGLTVHRLEQMRRLPGVRALEPRSLTAVRLYVDEAGRAVPRLVEAIRNEGVDVESVREYHPTFDEVFARLVEKAA